MSAPILATKLYIPAPRPKFVLRPRLIERLNEGLHHPSGMTLISAPAGFGKTTLASSWIAHLRTEAASQEKIGNQGQSPTGRLRPLPEGKSEIKNRVAWLSLDEGDNDPARFLAHLIAALQTIVPKLGAGVLGMLHSPQPLPPETILTALLNDLTTLPEGVVLVLDDYHLIEAEPVDKALTFLLEHLPPWLHLAIATREDPPFPLARFRARGRLTELRAADLRFTAAEATEFLNGVMGLTLSAEEVAALEARTEGWIAGLQLAAISMRGHKDAHSFIHAFTGSHRFVMDYLLEEVLHQQPESVQTFLLRTSILDRLCGPLCEAILGRGAEEQGSRDDKNITPAPPLPCPPACSQETLEYLERNNLFIIPLDNERRWYRYHHLFAELLRQRLSHSLAGGEGQGVAEYHLRASLWYEANGLEIEAFQHAAAAHDVERAERLIEGEGMPLHFRGALVPVLNWLESLPPATLDGWPSLWTTYASVLLATGHPLTSVEEKLQAAEAALRGAEPSGKTRDLIGRVAAIRATVAANQRQAETIIAQSRRALEYLHPDNLSFRTFTIWKLGYAYHLQGDRAAAGQAYAEALSASQASGNTITIILATIGLGGLQETENRLFLAAQTYRQALQLIGELPLPVACEVHLGLARIFYEWNELDAAHQSLHLARQIKKTDRVISCEVLLARLKLAQGDGDGAAAILAQAGQVARQPGLVHRLPEVVAAQVLTLLHQGDGAAAAHLAQTHPLPLSQARVHLAGGNPAAALAALEPLRRQAESRGWPDERLKALVLEALAHQAQGEKDRAIHRLAEALALAEPGGFIRLFVDEGSPMARLLSEAARQGLAPGYTGKLLAAFPGFATTSSAPSQIKNPQSKMIEPLSQRELEVLHLIAQGLSNQEISEQLFLAVSTVKGHNRRIFDKLQVQRRTEAIARARELGVI